MNKFRRLLYISLCLLLTLSLFSNVYGAESSPGEQATYVLNHRVDGDDYNGPDIQYFSPYRLACTLDRKNITMKNCLFSLYNTVADEVIPAYCSDITVLANSNYAYRRMNLEDSTFAAGAAGQIRSIVVNGFYIMPIKGESDEAHAARVARELERLGDAAGVEDLTIGEAITGTQSAIWQAAHGTGLVYKDFLHSMYMEDVSDSVKYYDMCNEERYNGHVDYNGIENGNAKITRASDREVGGRIQTVYNYLMAQEPMAPMESIVSPASFREISGPFAADNADGTFDLTVTVTVNVRMEEGDALTLSASLADTYHTSVPLQNGSQTLTLKLNNVPSELIKEKVLLEIQGLQSGYDVYLFDSVGDRETSQSMVGMVDGRLPVYASISSSITETHNDRILNFYKTTPIPNGADDSPRHPLEGITFDIYFVAEFKEYLSGQVKLPDATEYETPSAADFTLVTNQDGRVSINLTQKGMPDGVYLVVEREHPAIKAPVDPFYVIMPATNAEGTGYEYEITVQPKNEVKGNIRIEKDVISLGNNSASVDAYEAHTWIIGTNIPEDIANGKSFVISDTLDPRLDYIGNMRVQVETADGKTVVTTLEEGKDYILQVTDSDSMTAQAPSDAFSITLTPVGMVHVGGSMGEDSVENYMLRVYFDAQINGNAKVDEDIPNEATLDYTNSVNFDFSAKSDKPVVKTGAAKILKVDGNEHSLLLPGAEFEVYRNATEQEVAAGEGLHYIPGSIAPMVKVSFFDKEELTGEKVTTAISDADGIVNIYGLAYGEYYILETKAPAGYTLMGEAVKLIIDKDTHTPEKLLTVENINGTVLPSTGGPGTEIYLITGLILLCGAAFFLFIRKAKTTS